MKMTQNDFSSNLGLGRFSENCVLSFIQDNFFPMPHNEKILEKCDPRIKQKSWKRRVDVNTLFYFVVLIVFAVLNILYKTDIINPIDIEGISLLILSCKLELQSG